MKKLLIISPTFFPIIGGAEIGIHELATRFSSKYSVTILTPYQNKVMNGGYDMSKYKVVYFKDRFQSEDGIKGKINKLLSLTSLFYIMAIRKEINRNKPDIINFHYAIPTGLAIIYSKVILGIPVVLSLVGRVDVYNRYTSIFRKIYLRIVFHFTSKIVAINEYCVDLGLQKINIIPYGVNINDYSNVSSREINLIRSKYKSELILFSLQRLESIKRVDILIKSMEYFKKDKKKIVLLIGGKGEETEKLIGLTHKLKLEKYVKFLGFISDNDIPKYYKASDLFVFHSTFETFGVVLAQAMAASKAIVTTNISAIPFVVKNRENGILVKPYSPKLIYHAITELISNSILKNSIERNNYKKAQMMYDWNIVTDKYDLVFKQLI